EKAKAELAAFLNVPEADISILSAQSKAWPNTSLGGYISGVTFARAVEGFSIVLKAGDRTFEYHGDYSDNVVLNPDRVAEKTLVIGALSELETLLMLPAGNLTQKNVVSVTKVIWADDTLGGYRNIAPSATSVNGYKIVIKYENRLYEYHTDKLAVPNIVLNPVTALSHALVNKALGGAIVNTGYSDGLSGLLGITTVEMELYSVTPMTWSDDTLGGYADVGTPTAGNISGYKIILKAGGKNYEFHTDNTSVYIDPVIAASIPAIIAAYTDLSLLVPENISIDAIYPYTWENNTLGGYRIPGVVLDSETEGFIIYLKAGNRTYKYHIAKGDNTAYLEPLAIDTMTLVNGAISNLVNFGSLGISASDVNLYSLESFTWEDDTLGGYRNITPSVTNVAGYKIILEAKGIKYEYHADNASAYLEPLTGESLGYVNTAIANLAAFLGVPADKIKLNSVYRAVWQDETFGGFNAGGLLTGVTSGYKIFLKYKDVMVEYRADYDGTMLMRDPRVTKYAAINTGYVFDKRGNPNTIYNDSGISFNLNAGRLTSISDARGGETILNEREGLAESIAAPVVRRAKLWDIVVREFDSDGDITKETRADGSYTLYDSEGRAIEEEDENGNVAEYTYIKQVLTPGNSNVGIGPARFELSALSEGTQILSLTETSNTGGAPNTAFGVTVNIAAADSTIDTIVITKESDASTIDIDADDIIVILLPMTTGYVWGFDAAPAYLTIDDQDVDLSLHPATFEFTPAEAGTETLELTEDSDTAGEEPHAIFSVTVNVVSVIGEVRPGGPQTVVINETQNGQTVNIEDVYKNDIIKVELAKTTGYTWHNTTPNTATIVSNYILPESFELDDSVLTLNNMAHIANTVNPQAFGETAWTFKAESWGVTKLVFLFKTEDDEYAETEDVFYVDVRLKAEPNAGGPQTVNVTYEDLGKAIDVNIGDTLVLTLKEGGLSPYKWQIFTGESIAITGSVTDPAYREFTFEAREKGEITLDFIQKALDKLTEPQINEKFNVTIKVSDTESETPQTVNITYADKGNTITVNKNDIIKITLDEIANYSWIFAPPAYNSEGKTGVISYYDSNGKLTRRVFQDGSIAYYDENGKLIKIADIEGKIIYEYNGERPATITDQFGNVYTYTYDEKDAAENPVKVNDVVVSVTVTSPWDIRRFNEAGDLLSITDIDYAANVITYEYEKDSNGKVTKKIETGPDFGNGPEFVNTYSYNSNGDITKVIDKYNQETKYEYDVKETIYGQDAEETFARKITGPLYISYYNKDSDLLYIVHYYDRTNVTKYTYEKDSKGNHVSAVEEHYAGELYKEFKFYEYDKDGMYTLSADASGNIQAQRNDLTTKLTENTTLYRMADAYGESDIVDSVEVKDVQPADTNKCTILVMFKSGTALDEITALNTAFGAEIVSVASGVYELTFTKAGEDITTYTYTRDDKKSITETIVESADYIRTYDKDGDLIKLEDKSDGSITSYTYTRNAETGILETSTETKDSGVTITSTYSKTADGHTLVAKDDKRHTETAYKENPTDRSREIVDYIAVDGEDEAREYNIYYYEYAGDD
ncbi:MAG: protease inhibitor I42 family protein, partial [Candidatus Omnitrophota bacterium]|nr:protease inhibitor I42 family protein [Candidatus Omnitrophota bacterium]